MLEDLPADVRHWLEETLVSGEFVAACLFADILPNGRFGERWIFLTNRRLVALGAENGDESRIEVALDLPVTSIRKARVQSYVGSSALFIDTAERGHELARFSLASQHEALDLAYYLNTLAEEREKGRAFEDVSPPYTKRPENRCPNCGRALSRWSEVCMHCLDHRRILGRLFEYLRPYIKTAILGLTLTMAITGLQLMPPFLTKVLIDRVITPGNRALLPPMILVLIGVHVAAALISVFRGYIMQWIGQSVLYDMRVELYTHLQRLRLRFYSQRETGRIMARVTSDLNRLQYFIAEGFQEALVNISTMLLITLIMVLMNWRLFLIALMPTPIIALSTWLFGHRMHLLYHRIWRRSAGLSAILADTIPGIRVVKAFAQEDRESGRFAGRSGELFSEEMRAARLSTAFFPFLGLQTSLGSILIFSVGGYMVMNGLETVGTLVAFTSYLWRFYGPVQQFGHMNHRFQHCVTSAERVFEILDSDPEPQHKGARLDSLRGSVEFRNVRFSYEPGKYALDGISFSVEPGEMIGLVGPSGAGKSTLVHLIARFYDVEEGEILIDGVSLTDLDLGWFRSQIGVVLQEPYLFHGTIWGNIAYANPDATTCEILEAARAANAHEFIVNLPEGYDTVIGERGMTLSGGERQRISIARAVLRDPRILILDEATASVDTETEAKIQIALERLVENRTTFAIAHRLSTLRKADRLVVLERSKLVEIGTHDELIDTGGLYSRLCELQAQLSKMRAV